MGEEFNKIYNEIIVKVIEQAKGGITDKEIKTSLFVNTSEDYYNSLHNVFENTVNQLKKDVFPDKNIKECRLDIHKIAAVICYSLIVQKPFCFNEAAANSTVMKYRDDIPHLSRNALVNYRVAFFCAMEFIYYNCIYDERYKRNYEEYHEELAKLTGLKKYDRIDNTQEQHTPFEESLIFYLSKYDKKKQPFNFLFFSTILYQWEEYTKLYIEKKNLEKKFATLQSNN